MARIWMDGFEHQQPHNYLTVRGTPDWLTGRRGYGTSLHSSMKSGIGQPFWGSIEMFTPPILYQAEVFVRLAIMQTGRIGILKFKNSLNETFCTLTIPSGLNVDIVCQGDNPVL